MKIALIIFIVSGISYLGYGLSSFYQKRQHLLSDIISFCDCLISDIDFLHIPLKTIIENRTKQFGAEMCRLLKAYRTLLDEATLNNLSDKITSIYFKKDEAQAFCSLLFELGKSDCVSQVGTIKNFKTVFEKYNIDAQEDSKKYSPLYLKLGILTGIMLALLLI